jgi:hypothetical protein
VLESKDGDGTVPAVAAGRELSGRRNTEQYLLHSRLPAHPSTISHASPLATTPAAKVGKQRFGDAWEAVDSSDSVEGARI